MEDFGSGNGKKFSQRDDLCRIPGCYHRFHKSCLHTYWFVKPEDEIGVYGAVIKHEVLAEKKCPICRTKVSERCG